MRRHFESGKRSTLGLWVEVAVEVTAGTRVSTDTAATISFPGVFAKGSPVNTLDFFTDFVLSLPDQALHFFPHLCILLSVEGL